MLIKEKIKKSPKLLKFISKTYNFFVSIKPQYALYKKTKKKLRSVSKTKDKIFYFGIPITTNLGDLAQGVCIRRWLKKHYPNKMVVEIETNSIANTKFPAIKALRRAFREGDFVVFQSGYCTTDLSSYADNMHKAVMKALPKARMLMLPQTILFLNKKKERDCSKKYNAMKRKMLFLARDEVSFNIAKTMFPDVNVRNYPDIVTTLIGNYEFNNDRKGVLFCCRNDGEKLYSEQELSVIRENLAKLTQVDLADTTKKMNMDELTANAEKYVLQEIENYSKYQVIITDRYHGTIFSIIANTPVIIIKTTDHKVITGAKWFEGDYNYNVYVANTLEEAEQIAKDLLEKNICAKHKSYFEQEYYDKLPALFEETTRESL